MEPESAQPRSTAPSVRRRWAPRSAFVIGLAGGVFVTAIVCGVLLALHGRSEDPAYTDEAMAEALRLWTENGPADYDMEIVISGRRSGRVYVEVREGRPLRVVRDEVVLSNLRTMTPWTVPGMFEIVEIDARHAADAAEGQGEFADGEPTRIAQWVSFDEQYGYPRRYHRLIEGTPQEIRWKVTRFVDRSADR